MRHASVDPEGNDSSEEYSDILGLEAPFLGVALGLFPVSDFCAVCPPQSLIYSVVESLTLTQETSVSTLVCPLIPSAGEPVASLHLAATTTAMPTTQSLAASRLLNGLVTKACK